MHRANKSTKISVEADGICLRKILDEIVLFTDGDINIEVQINLEQETVWLTQKQMEELFDVKHATVSEHITNILASGELDEASVDFSDKSSGGRKNQD